MSFVPSINTKGIYTLTGPWADKLLEKVPYECVAVRKLSDLLAEGKDPKALFYTANGLDDTAFNNDVAAGVCIITLQAGSVSTIYVPSSYIAGYPETGGVPYTRLLLGVDLGAVPDALDLTYLKTKIGETISDIIGITAPTVNVVVASPTTILSDTEHAALEATRQANMDAAGTDYAKFLQEKSRADSLAARNEELENFILSLNLPNSVTAPAAITPADHPTDLLQTGNPDDGYWLEDNAWNAGTLTRGTFTDISGTTYEQETGVSSTMGPRGEVAGRVSWKWPTGNGEVKSFMSMISGKKPGWASPGSTPAGLTILDTAGAVVSTSPSGATPGTFFPLKFPVAKLFSSFGYEHNAPPTGRGQLTYEIWLQNTSVQQQGVNSAGEITHEIVIPLDYWGEYGAYPTRNAQWYVGPVQLDGRMWHLYAAMNAEGELLSNYGGGWKFIVFEPVQPITDPGTINLATLLNYLLTKKDSAGAPWVTGNEWISSVELGVEPVDGEGDLTLYNYRVWK